jgi:hypothetical protein
MSINPVPGIGPASDAQSAEVRAIPQREPASARSGQEVAQPDPGTPPKQEARILPNVSEFQELPQDEVQVLRDQATTEIVIKYLDRSGSVILQVPSSEVLGVVHAIDQDLAQEAKIRASAAAASTNAEGGKAHGH